MEVIEQFILTSKELKRLLEEDFLIEQREQHIKKMDELLKKRQQQLSQFPEEPTLDELTKQEMMVLETEIQALMKNQKENIKQDIKILQIKKRNTNQYANPYDNLSVDGMFLDKKK